MDNSSVKPFNFWENTVEFIVHLKHINYIFPIKHKEENRLRIEGADGNVIFNVIVPTNPPKDEQKEEE